jgi:hypothetical protein
MRFRVGRLTVVAVKQHFVGVMLVASGDIILEEVVGTEPLLVLISITDYL